MADHRPTVVQPAEVDEFWESDLDDLESPLLPRGTSVVDLPIYLDRIVVAQGSVILSHARKVEVPEPTFWQALKYYLRKLMRPSVEG